MFTPRYLIAGAFLWVGAIQVSAASAIFDVTMDTSALNGTSASLVFDFIDGDTVVNNSVTISDFAGDGQYDPTAAMTFGDVTGALNTSAVLGDSSGFSELLQPIVLGDSLAFMLTLSNQFSGVDPPDRLTLFLLDQSGLFPLYATSDPTGSDALLAIDLGGGTARAVVYAPTAPGGAIVEAKAVPEPPIWSLWLIGALIGRRFLRAAPARP
jgi:hypothetical protein